MSETKKISWRCPSNIAVVKYWGKHGRQLPCNASLSLTLSKSFTETQLRLVPNAGAADLGLEYFFDGRRNMHFEARVHNYVSSLRDRFPFLSDFSLHFDSSNSFPHSAGIASSASAFGAIALCLLEAEILLSEKERSGDFFREASHLARLGSGSASRSLFGGYALWGALSEVEGSSDEHALQVRDVHPDFQDVCNAILIVEHEPKKVSSSLGHSLMNGHPYAASRFLQGNARTKELLGALKGGDWGLFVQIAESEALTLHAMMMTSTDYYLLMKAGTITAIEKIIDFRKETKRPVCFTLDAGPNLHVLYPKSEQQAVEDFLKNNFQMCVQEIIFDGLGAGPQLITS